MRKNGKIVIRYRVNENGTFTAKYYGFTGTASTLADAWINLKGNLWAGDVTPPYNPTFQKEQ